MDTIINVLINLISSFTGVVNSGVNLANYYSSNWGKLLVYGLLIFVGAKLLKVNLKVDVKKGRG